MICDMCETFVNTIFWRDHKET